MSDKEAELKKIREKALADTEKVAPKARFGLFSSPPPLSIGDDSYDRKKLRILNNNKRTSILKIHSSFFYLKIDPYRPKR